MWSHWRRHDVQQQAGSRMERRKNPGGRKPAARCLISRLPELLSEFRGVRHGERRAIEQEGPVPAPETRLLGDRDQALDHASESRLEDEQGQARPCLAIGFGRKGTASEKRDVRQRGVAVEYLKEEPMNDGKRGQQAFAPDMAGP